MEIQNYEVFPYDTLITLLYFTLIYTFDKHKCTPIRLLFKVYKVNPFEHKTNIMYKCR